MALEPITRQEKIISGENLKPITRMEMFLKEFGGGGSGGGSGGVSPEEVATIVKEQFPGGVGYSEVTETYGDTLTWDGNTADVLEAFYPNGEPAYYYKVSDAVLTNDQLKAATVTVHSPDRDVEIIVADVWDGADSGGGYVSDEWANPDECPVIIVRGHDVYVDTIRAVFPEPGIYFARQEYDGMVVYMKSMTIPGYGGFKTVTEVTKKLDAKYLPNTGGMYYVNPENFVWADVLAAYKSGALLYALNGFSVMYPCRVEDGDVDDSYIEFSNIIPSWGQVYGLKIWGNGMFEYQTYDVELSIGK